MDEFFLIRECVLCARCACPSLGPYITGNGLVAKCQLFTCRDKIDKIQTDIIDLISYLTFSSQNQSRIRMVPNTNKNANHTGSNMWLATSMQCQKWIFLPISSKSSMCQWPYLWLVLENVLCLCYLWQYSLWKGVKFNFLFYLCPPNFKILSKSIHEKVIIQNI